MRDLTHIPKAELHCHIEGSVLPELAISQATKYNIDISRFVDQDHGYIWSDFSGFLKTYDLVSELFKTPEDYAILSQAHYENLASQGCLYGEIFISPDHVERVGISYQAMVEAICEGIDRAREKTGIEGRMIVTGVRHMGPQSVMNAAQLAVKYPHPLVTGFGMAGDERMWQARDFKKAFQTAGDGGLKLTCHAGEFAGSDSVRQVLDQLGVQRIGHGVRCIEDNDLVKRIVDEEIVLEVCPVSNIALGVFDELKKHPIGKLDELGCKLTISSDDPPYFHTSLQNDYEQVADIFNYDDEKMISFTKASIHAAFVDDKTRRGLLEKCLV